MRGPWREFAGGSGGLACEMGVVQLGMGVWIVLFPLFMAGADLEWHQASWGRYRDLEPGDGGKVGFTRMSSSETGMVFTNHIDAGALLENQILELGSGVALGDMDGDGLPDLFVGSMSGKSRLFRNLGGLRFEDVSEKSGVDLEGAWVTGVMCVDVDGDGDGDLLVNGIGKGTRLFRNRGGGVFEEMVGSGLWGEKGSSSLAMADLDGNGTLDLYVANYHSRTVKDQGIPPDLEAGWVNGRFVISKPELFRPLFSRAGGVSLFELGEADVCYLNDGKGHFVPQSWTGGMFLDAQGRVLESPPRDWGLSVSLRDLNGDGLPDIYVCNDFFSSVDRVWLNQGGGRFRAAAAGMLRHGSMSSMSVDFSDLDRDGYDDFFVADMMSVEHVRRHRQRGSLVHVEAMVPLRDPGYAPEYPRNSLFISQSGRRFVEMAQYAGLEATDWTWGTMFLDVDLDGYEDLLLTAGNARDGNDADRALGASGGRGTKAGFRVPLPRLNCRLQAYRNQGDLTFQSRGSVWGFDAEGVAHGMACADLDRDGDLDVVVNPLDRNLEVYRNDVNGARVSVQLRGRGGNTEAIGARIVLHGGLVALQSKVVVAGGRYLSSDEPMAVFGVRSNGLGMRLSVQWPDGRKSEVGDIRAWRHYELVEPEVAEPMRDDGGKEGKGETLFVPWTPVVRSVHVRAAGLEQGEQPLVSRSADGRGPGVCWYDMDGDGWEDLVVGAGRGGMQVIYLNDAKGGFRSLRRAEKVAVEQSTVLAWRDDAGKAGLWLGSFRAPRGEGGSGAGDGAGEDEAQGSSSASVAYLPLEESRSWAGVKSWPYHVGPMALGIYEGHRVLFVGGFGRPGRLGEPASSLLLEEVKGNWTTNTSAEEVLRGMGTVTGAVWTQLDSEAGLELVVTRWWGDVRIFGFVSGRWMDRTSHFGLDSGVGFWNGVDTGDLDGDGRLDLVVGNWGWNNGYRRHLHHPVRVDMGDWTQSGRWDVLESSYEDSLGGYAPWVTLDRLRQHLPHWASRYPSYAEYSRVTVDALLGDDISRGRVVMLNELASCVFLNRGLKMEKKVLPMEAQLSAVSGVGVGDLNGDGKMDLVLAQNEFGWDAEVTRQDAGRGLVMLGDGTGGWRVLREQESGVGLDGEMRAVAFCDADRDGRLDLAISQNGGALGLFRNHGGKPGLRVRVEGPGWNRDAVGVVMRGVSSRGKGPAMVLRVGCGYWSQHGLVALITGEEGCESIELRWPTGEEQTVVVPRDAKEVMIRR